MERYIKENAEDWTKVGAKVTQLASTNDSLREQVQAFAKTGHVLPEGYSLQAEYQSAGKGRLGRIWDAEPGQNLLISYLLSSAGLRPDQLFLLLQNVALAVREAIQSFVRQYDVKVKWPNDILVNEKKIAGILIESVLAGGKVSYIIVGIGINVNQMVFPTNTASTSLSLLTGMSYKLDQVTKNLSLSLQSAHTMLKSTVRTGDFYSLQQKYHLHLFGFGEWLIFLDLQTNTEILAKHLGVSQTGDLRLEQQDKELRYSLDEVRFIRKYGVRRKALRAK